MEDLILNINENWNDIKTDIDNYIERYKKQPNGI